MTDDPFPITISRERHKELLDAERRLDALEAAGVDNWEGYDEAIRDYYGGSE